jgi:DNA repair protein RadA/Sms
MVKTRTSFFCQNCGAQSPKWIGRCNSCGEWNTYVEEVVERETKSIASILNGTGNQPKLLQDVSDDHTERIDTLNGELNRVLGGGLVPGSLVLIGGEPGIGKSTLVLQLALDLKHQRILYVSGEESIQQIKIRAHRLQKENSGCYFLSETSLERLLEHSRQIAPGLLIIDSIQTVATEQIESSPGSVGQIRECTNAILKYAKENQVPVILIGHINKEGSLAGPKVLEHIVDTVLQFEGENQYMYRILRAIKNRFGPTSELGIFEMGNGGLREVTNPSELLINREHEGLSGTAISASIEGIRPLLIEIQALISTAAYGTPQRSSTGFDLRRLNMLLAVLEKRAGFRLATKDVFLNIAGGIKVDDPGIDLAVITAILSSNFDRPIRKNVCFAGEVGLSGEIRAVTRLEQRIAEAEKLGFDTIFIPKVTKGINLQKFKIEILQFDRVEGFFKSVFGKDSR